MRAKPPTLAMHTRPSGARALSMAPRRAPMGGASPAWRRRRRIRPECGASIASRTRKATPRPVAVPVDMAHRVFG
jgi:hypothetical protein